MQHALRLKCGFDCIYPNRRWSWWTRIVSEFHWTSLRWFTEWKLSNSKKKNANSQNLLFLLMLKIHYDSSVNKLFPLFQCYESFFHRFFSSITHLDKPKKSKQAMQLLSKHSLISFCFLFVSLSKSHKSQTVIEALFPLYLVAKQIFSQFFFSLLFRFRFGKS